MTVAATRTGWVIPARLNITLALSAWLVAAGLLWLGSHAQAWWHWLLACLGFALVNNTIFSLLHETVHGVFHPNRQVNLTFGRICAALFPTG